MGLDGSIGILTFVGLELKILILPVTNEYF